MPPTGGKNSDEKDITSLEQGGGRGYLAHTLSTATSNRKSPLSQKVEYSILLPPHVQLTIIIGLHGRGGRRNLLHPG